MNLDELKENEIEEIVKKMSFNDGIDFYIDILKYLNMRKTNQLMVCYSFVDYINNNFNKFKYLLEQDNNLKKDLQDLFGANIEQKEDNLVSIIIDNPDNVNLIELLNDKLNFKDYYLTDNVMTLISDANAKIYNNLEGKEKKYIPSVFNNLYYDREEQMRIYKDVLKDYPLDFIKKLFSFCEIIYENIPNDTGRYKEINKMMFNFTEKVIENKEKLYNYLYNITHIYNFKPTEQELYNIFLIGVKYKEIHEVLLNDKLSNSDIFEKLRILSYLPPLKGIVSLSDLENITNNDLYELEMDNSKSINKEVDSVYARNNYEYKIFESNREVIKITDEEIKVVNLTDDYRESDTEYSHIDGLKKLYPEYSDKEMLGEIIVLSNSINHDIILLTEGDGMSIWLPNIDNISLSKTKKLKEKLDQIKDIKKISVTVASECEGTYLDIPFSKPDILIDYLKTNKKVK